MRLSLSRAMLQVAVQSLGSTRGEWAAAMKAEHEVACEAGDDFGFALGCVVAAWRELLRFEEGRLLAARYMLSVGVIVPVAAFLLLGAMQGVPFIVADGGPLTGLLGRGLPDFPVTEANAPGIPLLCALTITLGLGHLLIAWALLEMNWNRVAFLGRLGAAVMTSILIFSSILFLADLNAVPQAIVLAGELAAIWTLVRWHDEAARNACGGCRPSG